MSKKKLNTDTIKNELVGASGLFPYQKGEKGMYSKLMEVDKQKNMAVEATKPPLKEVEKKEELSMAIPQTIKQEIQLAINIAILHNEIDDLMKNAYKSQTFRFTPEELKKLRDLSYSLSNLLDKKITQGDLLRLGFLLLKKHLADNKESMITLLKTIK